MCETCKMEIPKDQDHCDYCLDPVTNTICIKCKIRVMELIRSKYRDINHPMANQALEAILQEVSKL